MTYFLWIIQALLAILFVVVGGAGLIVPVEALTQGQPVPEPEFVVRGISLLELLGGLGLILPGVLNIRPWLTPLAAGGLVIVMSGATGFTLAGGEGTDNVVLAVVPLALGLFAALVAFGRWQLAPHNSTTRLVRKPVHGYETVA
jgi:DoxX-like family